MSFFSENYVALIIGLFTFVGGIYATRSARKANSETSSITGFKELVIALEKRVDAQELDLEKAKNTIQHQSKRIDSLERKEQIFIRWARSVVTWYNAVIPHLDGIRIPPFPSPPPGIEDTDPPNYGRRHIQE